MLIEKTDKFLMDCLANRTAKLNATDWESIVQFAVIYSVAPLLYHRIKSVNIPASMRQKLLKAYLISARRNTRLYSQLSKIIKALQDTPVIVLKGAHLAQNVYGNIALRPMNDIDILVRKTDLLKAEKNLLEIGYSSPRQNEIQVACAKHHHLPPLVKQGTVPVDIHWTIGHPSSPFQIDIEGLWKRAQPATIAGIKVLVLSPEDLLLHLCLHTAFHHLFRSGIRPFYDILETIRQSEIDWEQIPPRANQWGATNSVYLTLYLAKTLFRASVPNEILDRLKPDNFDPQIVSWAKARLFDKRAYPPTTLIQFWKSNSYLEKANLFLKRVFLSPEEMAQLYPVLHNSPKKLYFYYLVRLKELFLHHGCRTWLLLRRNKDLVNQAEQTEQLTDWLSR
jgi:hypothetical protein